MIRFQNHAILSCLAMACLAAPGEGFNGASAPHAAADDALQTKTPDTMKPADLPGTSDSIGTKAAGIPPVARDPLLGTGQSGGQAQAVQGAAEEKGHSNTVPDATAAQAIGDEATGIPSGARVVDEKHDEGAK